MNKTASTGFTLVELLVVIAIVAILAAVVVLAINPLELTRRARDTTRLADLENLQKAINLGLTDASGASAAFLCFGISTPCTGLSSTGTRSNNGSGWVKVNFTTLVAASLATLPADPTNNSTYHYTYYSDGTNYELNAVLESTQYVARMTTDGGNNNAAYETGTILTLLP